MSDILTQADIDNFERRNDMEYPYDLEAERRIQVSSADSLRQQLVEMGMTEEEIDKKLAELKNH